VANRKAKKDWGTILLQMALDARQEGDVVTSDLLAALALDYFDEADRLASRWQKIEAHINDHGAPRSAGRESPPSGRIAAVDAGSSADSKKAHAAESLG
jgi:hypothetical protein